MTHFYISGIGSRFTSGARYTLRHIELTVLSVLTFPEG